MGFISELLSKWSCHHEWMVHHETHEFENDYSKRPCRIIETIICKRCGKIKKIKL